MKIAIIGAGFAGLTAAINLNGHDLTIYEQAPTLKPVGAGVLMQPFGLSVLRQFGLDDEVISKGDRIERLYGLTRRNRNILNLRYQKYDNAMFGVGIHRGSLFRVLLDTAGNSNPRFVLNTNVLRIEDAETNPRLILENGVVTESFDLVIVANGSRSKFRSILSGKKFEEEYPWGALWGVFENRGIDEQTLYQRYHSTTKLLGYLPCGVHPETGKESVSFFWSLRESEHLKLKEKGIDSFIEDIKEMEPNCPLLDQITSWDNFAFVTYTDVYLQKWMNGKVLLIGDSAHGMSPQLGLGANMAIYDGYLTGQLLKGGMDSLSQLPEIRYKQNLFYHRVSRMMTPFFQSDKKRLGALRDITFPILPHLPFLDRLMVETLYGTRDGLFSRRELL
jgi:2-polyprenyl-6-methoxyphenol hydroxylase-like FAD-dependent oxidoreductase